MPLFTISECTEADMYPGFVLVSETFQHDQPYHDACWPDHWIPHGREASAQRFESARKSEPDLKLRTRRRAD